jgi:hypothetical protein
MLWARIAKKPLVETNLRLELNCESEGATSYRHKQRDGDKGKPHVLPRTRSTVLGYSHVSGLPSTRSATRALFGTRLANAWTLDGGTLSACDDDIGAVRLRAVES